MIWVMRARLTCVRVRALSGLGTPLPRRIGHSGHDSLSVAGELDGVTMIHREAVGDPLQPLESAGPPLNLPKSPSDEFWNATGRHETILVAGGAAVRNLCD